MKRPCLEENWFNATDCTRDGTDLCYDAFEKDSAAEGSRLGATANVSKAEQRAASSKGMPDSTGWLLRRAWSGIEPLPHTSDNAAPSEGATVADECEGHAFSGRLA
jgi:hypothetical protein